MESITTDQLAAMGEGAPLIDVREPEEFEAGRVPWAVNIPLSELVERLDEVPADETVYVICQAGGRSARACEYLAREGREVVNVEGGTGEWIAEGNEVARDEEVPSGERDAQ